MALTGYRDAPARMFPIPLASYADGVIAALNYLGTDAPLANLDGAQLLGERAAMASYRRAGDVAAGGNCRLLPTADGWLAVNLARDYDWDVLPAWLGMDTAPNWSGVADALKSRTVGDCVELGRLLGLATAAMDPPKAEPVSWCKEIYRTDKPRHSHKNAPLVIDLSSLWAGPLCAHLLGLLGARVVKVESTERPDGMRQGGGGFFDLLNAGKASVALNLNSRKGIDQLRQLLLSADIVIEASRPRALEQMGLLAEEILAENSGATWIGISGHGRELPAANWIAFGNDAGVAAGLSQILWECGGRPMFCGDAIADPLAGLHAAVAAWSSFAGGGGRLLSIALVDVVTHCIQFASLDGGDAIRARTAKWNTFVSPLDIAVPRSRPISGKAPALGANTVEILSGLGISC